jgi:very-short-patch-repair endonuclease
MLVIEVDGSQHVHSHHDAKRDIFMRASGWAILRFWNVDVLQERDAVLETILAVLEGRLTETVEARDLRFYPAKT